MAKKTKTDVKAEPQLLSDWDISEALGEAVGGPLASQVGEVEKRLAKAEESVEEIRRERLLLDRRIRAAIAQLKAFDLSAAMSIELYDEDLRKALLAMSTTRKTGSKVEPREGVVAWKDLQANGATDEQIANNLAKGGWGRNDWESEYAAGQHTVRPSSFEVLRGKPYTAGTVKVLSGKANMIAAVRRVLGIGQPQKQARKAPATAPVKPAGKPKAKPKSKGRATMAAKTREVEALRPKLLGEQAAEETTATPAKKHRQSWLQWRVSLAGLGGPKVTGLGSPEVIAPLSQEDERWLRERFNLGFTAPDTEREWTARKRQQAEQAHATEPAADASPITDQPSRPAATPKQTYGQFKANLARAKGAPASIDDAVFRPLWESGLSVKDAISQAGVEKFVGTFPKADGDGSPAEADVPGQMTIDDALTAADEQPSDGLEEIEVPISPKHRIKARVLLRHDSEGWGYGYRIEFGFSDRASGIVSRPTTQGARVQSREYAIKTAAQLLAGHIRSRKGQTREDKAAIAAAAKEVEKWAQWAGKASQAKQADTELRAALGDAIDMRLDAVEYSSGDPAECERIRMRVLSLAAEEAIDARTLEQATGEELQAWADAVLELPLQQVLQAVEEIHDAGPSSAANPMPLAQAGLTVAELEEDLAASRLLPVGPGDDQATWAPRVGAGVWINGQRYTVVMRSHGGLTRPAGEVIYRLQPVLTFGKHQGEERDWQALATSQPDTAPEDMELDGLIVSVMGGRSMVLGKNQACIYVAAQADPAAIAADLEAQPA